MKKRLVKVISVVIVLVLIAGSSSPFTLTAEAASVKKPVKITGLKKYAVGTNYVHFQWTKIKKNKNTKGYAVYLNGKLYKRVGVKAYRYKISQLKSNTSYKVSVRAYNTYKQKQYYNTKTKKWQTKKPAKKNWKGKKTRTVTKYAYGPTSATLTLKTQKNEAIIVDKDNGNKPHQHNYNIPIYAELEDKDTVSIYNCQYCDWSIIIYNRDNPNIKTEKINQLDEHAFAERNAWKEENGWRLTADNTDIEDRIAAKNEFDAIPYHTVDVNVSYISYGWIPHQIVGYGCSCGSMNLTKTGYRNMEPWK